MKPLLCKLAGTIFCAIALSLAGCALVMFASELNWVFLPTSSPKDWSQLAAGPATSFKILNSSREEISVYCLSNDGKKTLYFRLEPGEQRKQKLREMLLPSHS